MISRNSPTMRVYDSWTHRWIPFSSLLECLAHEDVVFVGEEHQDLATHHVEALLLEKLLSMRTVAVGMEMFERDVQTVLNAYLQGRITEAQFLSASRPWSNYAVAYRPLIEQAKAHHLEVLASNVPRYLAAAVAQHGLGAIERMPADHAWLFARHTTAPLDAYWTRFESAMQNHVGRDKLAWYYEAQCLKDDTMAESIADFFDSHVGWNGVLLHFNGAFHSDDGLGTVARTRARMPRARVATIRIVPTTSLDHADPKHYAADWIVFVEKATPANSR